MNNPNLFCSGSGSDWVLVELLVGLCNTTEKYNFSTSAPLGPLVLLVASDACLFVCLSIYHTSS